MTLQVVHGEREFALVVQQASQVPPAVPAYLRLLLNYLYGLEVLSAEKPAEAVSVAGEQGPTLRAVFVIQDEEVSNRNTITALGRRGELPLVLLMPPELAAHHQALSTGMPNVRVCGWDKTAGQDETSLQDAIGGIFAEHGIARLPVEAEGLPQDQLLARVRERMKHVGTLPTLPEIVVRLLSLLRDRQTTAEDLEKVVLTDPAIVHRLLQVVNSPAFSGTREGAGWTLKEAIVRLGHRRVGAIAQQVKLINSLVRPEGSQFDLRRFWEHSIGCACTADHLYRQRLLPLEAEIDFDLYWVAALLHDIGRLVLGFLAWDYYAQVLERTRDRDLSFGQAEERLGHTVTHEYLGRLMLLNSGASEGLAEVVGSHNNTGRHPGPLVCLVHIADGLTRELGFGYYPEERPSYSASVLATLGLSRERIGQIRDQLAPEVSGSMGELVSFCLPG